MNPEPSLEMQIQILQSENAELKAQLKAIADILKPAMKPRDTTMGSVIEGTDSSLTPASTDSKK
jgi:hypothetical protein